MLHTQGFQFIYPQVITFTHGNIYLLFITLTIIWAKKKISDRSYQFFDEMNHWKNWVSWMRNEVTDIQRDYQTNKNGHRIYGQKWP